MIVVGTGWCAFEDCRSNNPRTSPRCYGSSWLKTVWSGQIEKYIKPQKYHVYVSNCEILPDLDSRFEFVKNLALVETQHHAHDAYAAMVSGAQYALVNGSDYVYIEQDCLVHGLDKALQWAHGKNICYGYGKYSFQEGWAEESFQYISYDYLTTYITLMNSSLIYHDTTENPEKIYHRLFNGDVTPWPFGYGRKRPIYLSDEMFYAQQCTAKEIELIINE